MSRRTDGNAAVARTAEKNEPDEHVRRSPQEGVVEAQVAPA